MALTAKGKGKGKGKGAPVIDDYTKGGGGDNPLDGGSSISILIGEDPWNACGTAGQQQVGVTSQVEQIPNLVSGKAMTTPVNKKRARDADKKDDPEWLAAKKASDADRYATKKYDPEWLAAKRERDRRYYSDRKAVTTLEAAKIAYGKARNVNPKNSR